MWLSWETPSIFNLKHNSSGEREKSGPEAERERVKRGGVGVEMCSHSSLESYNFILLFFLRGWKVFLSTHFQPCLLLFFSIHFCLLRRGVAVVKVSIGTRKRLQLHSATCPPTLTLKSLCQNSTRDERCCEIHLILNPVL